MSGLAARKAGDGQNVHSEIWFWSWTLAALALVLIPALLWLRRVGEVTAIVGAMNGIFDGSRPIVPPPTIARLLWFDAKLLPNALVSHALAGLILGSIVGLLQAAGVRGRAQLWSWVGQSSLAWITGSVVGFLVARSYVVAAHPEVLLDVRGAEFFDRMFAPCTYGAMAGVLAATIAQLRRLSVRPIRNSRLLVWPVAAALFLHLGTVAVIAGARRAELGEIWRQRSVEALIVTLGWQTDWSWTALKYEEACRERMPAACAAYAGLVGDGTAIDPPETFDSDADRQQRVINLNLMACAGGSGAGCAALGNLYRDGRFAAHSDTWAALFDRHACMLGARRACERATRDWP
jgi:hypothetical protein